VLGVNAGESNHGVFTMKPGALTHAFFVNLLDRHTECQAWSDAREVFEGPDRKTGVLK